MKKILFISFCLFMLCGCSGKNIGYQISNLVPTTNLIGSTHKYNEVSGTLKNISNDTCAEVKVNFTFVNGNIKDTGWVVIASPEIGNYVGFNETAYGATGINNWELFKITINDVECWERKDTNYD